MPLPSWGTDQAWVLSGDRFQPGLEHHDSSTGPGQTTSERSRLGLCTGGGGGASGIFEVLSLSCSATLDIDMRVSLQCNGC